MSTRDRKDELLDRHIAYGIAGFDSPFGYGMVVRYGFDGRPSACVWMVPGTYGGGPD